MKKKISGILIIVLAILMLGQVSYAAVEIIPSKNGAGTDGMTNISVTNAYLLCQGMVKTGESLKGTLVLPHLATNADWGAVSYLSNSIYGTNTVGQNTGVEITIDNVKYYSTTGNITGVMNWGSNPNIERYTQTSGIIQAYDNDTSPVKQNVVELYNNKDTRYVDIINTNTGAFTKNNTLGMALAETSGFYNTGNGWSNYSTKQDAPNSLRNGLFGFIVGANGANGMYSRGGEDWRVIFRPVVWNQ